MGTTESSVADKEISFLRYHLSMYSGLQSQKDPQTFYKSSYQQSNLKKQKVSSKELFINKLELGNINQGRLTAFILLPAVKLTSIMFPIVDKNGDCINFAIYNSKLPEIQYQIGEKITIQNPYFKMGNDGRELIRMDDPKDLVFDEINLSEYFSIMTIFLKRMYQKDQSLPFDIVKTMKKFKHLQQTQEGTKWLQSIQIELQSVKIQCQEKEINEKNEQQPYWKNHHIQLEKIKNSSPEELLDENQFQEMQEMMLRMDIFARFQTANNLVMTDPERALNIFENLLKEDQKFAVIYFNYGELQFQIGNYPKCLEAMKQFLTIHQKRKFSQSKIYNFSHYHIGISLMMLGQETQAEQYLKQACQLDPQNLTFLQALSGFYYKTSNQQQAKQLSEELVQNFQNVPRDFDDSVELQRSLYLLFKISQKEHNFDKLVENADSLAKIEKENFIYIYNDITHYFLDQLNEVEQQILINKLKNSQYFDIICEELQLLYFLNLNDQVKQFEELDNYKNQQQDNFEIDTIVEENTNNFETKSIELQLLEIIKPEKNEINFDRNYIIEEIKQKKRKIVDQKKQKQIISENSQKYKGYFAQFEMQSSKYIITLDSKIVLEPDSLRQKFMQAAYKGFVHSKYGQSGIKQIKFNNKQIYELKIMKRDLRLICFSREKLGKNFFQLHFEKVMDHKEVKRLKF